MATLVFLHGLNTFGDDLLHVGPATFGPMHSRLERAFRERDIDFIPVTGLGAASPEEQARRALGFLNEVGLGDYETDLHLLGQSTGGLVARALAARPEMRERVRSIITMGTPHGGTLAATFGLDFEAKYPRTAKLFRACGYDTAAKSAIFRHFTPDAMAEFNRRHPSRPGVREVSLLCEVEKRDLSWPLHVFYKRLHKEDDSTSDGFILSSSQKWGEALGPFGLDHFGELGFFFQTSLRARRKSALEFDRMVDTVTRAISKRDKAERTARAP